MNSVWQSLTLTTAPLQRWREASLLHRPVGWLRNWRRGSQLMQWAEEIGFVLLALVFGLAPFVQNSLVGVLLFACACYWVLLTLSDDEETHPNRKSQPGMTPIHLLVLVYWGVVTIATAASPVKRAAFSGWSKLTLYLVLFALLARVLRSPRLRSALITVYLHAALLVSVYGLRQWFFGASALATWVDPTSPLARTTRVYSYLGNPNLLAGYLIPAVIFSIVAFFAWRGWVPKLLALIMTGVNGACLVLTFSRGGWIGITLGLLALTVLLVYWLSVHLPHFWRIWAMPLVVGIMVGLIVLGIVFVPPLRDRAASIFMGRGDSSNNFRINVWAAVIDMIQHYPVLGIGPGNVAFNKIYPLFQRARFSALSAYSQILEVTLEAGFIGLFSFLWLLSVTFTQGFTQLKRLRQQGNRDGFWLMGAIASLVGLMGHGLVDTVLYRPQVNTLWWLAFALIASFYVGHTTKDSVEPV